MKSVRYLVLAVAAVLLPLAYSGVSLAGHGVHWGYEGEGGPSHWGDLSEEYEACKSGTAQSPVDITGVVEADLPAIEFHYNAVPLKIINNGHAIQVNYPEGSSVTIGGKTYELLQFHFHGPSENVVNGTPYDMEAHLVHKDKDGKLAVVAVFMKKGKENAFIQTLWDNLPDGEGVEKEAKGVNISAADLLPGDRTYYSFSGSLTTPPCSEGVSWSVLKAPVEVSAAQVAVFSRYYEMNARPVQPLNKRVVRVGR